MSDPTDPRLNERQHAGIAHEFHCTHEPTRCECYDIRLAEAQDRIAELEAECDRYRDAIEEARLNPVAWMSPDGLVGHFTPKGHDKTVPAGYVPLVDGDALSAALGEGS